MINIPGAVALISSLSTFVVALYYLLKKIVLLKNEIKWLAIYSAYSFINNQLLDFTSETTNTSLLFIFTIIEYAIFAWLYYNMLHSLNSKRTIMLGSFVFLGIVCFSIMNFDNRAFDNINSGTEAVLIIIYSILFFVERGLAMDIVEPIYEKAEFWIVLGCFIYLSGNLFLFVTSDLHNQTAWMINSIFNLVRNIFFFIAIRKCSIVKKDPGPDKIKSLDW
jgi:hypothetical protein